MQCRCAEPQHRAGLLPGHCIPAHGKGVFAHDRSIGTHIYYFFPGDWFGCFPFLHHTPFVAALPQPRAGLRYPLGTFEHRGLAAQEHCWGEKTLSSYLGNVPGRFSWATLPLCPSEQPGKWPYAGAAGRCLPTGFVVMDTVHAANP